MSDGEFLINEFVVSFLFIFKFLEDIIKKRLLIDGDGTGDDRRLNMLLKQFLKWMYSKNDSPENK